LSEDALSKMPKNTIGFPEKLAIKYNKRLCEGCLKGKMTSKSFPESSSHATELFGLVHSDLKTLPVLLYHRYKYFIVFVDDMSFAYWINCLKSKADAKGTIKAFIAYIKNQFNTMIKCWCIDAGGILKH
jgi:hypothetical protein